MLIGDRQTFPRHGDQIYSQFFRAKNIGFPTKKDQEKQRPRLITSQNFDQGDYLFYYDDNNSNRIYSS